MIPKFAKTHQQLFFEIRPDTLRHSRVDDSYWSFVKLDDLDEAELVRAARATVTTKKVRLAIAGYDS